ncbi:hypothetical protein [Microvirga sp. M2]|uniref:hypothetical protein n=1 Tax=Microvirga sp. M2 TaxID=3073270 RepID=UPI0039C40D3E
MPDQAVTSCRSLTMMDASAPKEFLAVLRRHWTSHALRRFGERYKLDDYEPEALIDLVERIERKYRVAFANPYWKQHARVMGVAKLFRRNLNASPRVRLVYNRRHQVVVTVLPL